MKKILLSIGTVGVLSTLVYLGFTGAFFSDTETSTGNQLVAGALDLKIDNTCYYNGQACEGGQWVGGDNEGEECSCTWELKDLDKDDVFFDFRDLKPGDWEEDTISLHVDNPAWVCAKFNLTENDDNTCTTPEIVDDPTCSVPGAGQGELAQNLHFVFWYDDGDNVLEQDERVITQGEGKDVLGASWALADSGTGNGPIPAGKDVFIGKAFCYGTLGLSPLPAGNHSPVGPITNSGISCDGKPVNNASQTDIATGDVVFEAVQARHNENFLCSGEQKLVLENETENPIGPWTPIIDGTQGILTWKGDGPTFDYSLTAHGLLANTNYNLIYYADPWQGNNPGAYIGTGISDPGGNLAFSGNPNLGVDIPTLPDTNIAGHGGGKIWLVLSADYNGGAPSTGPMTGWNPSQYLFEGNVYINYNDTNN